MAYEASSKFPLERASKIGHIKIIKDPKIQRLMEAFEHIDQPEENTLGELSGHLELDDLEGIEKIVAIDGSHSVIPHDMKNHKQLAFVVSSAIMLRRDQFLELKNSPLVDPRDMAKMMEDNVISAKWALPLSGISLPGESISETIRELIDQCLIEHELYDTLIFLISREWDPGYSMVEHMDCLKCGKEFSLPKSRRTFNCPHCNAAHTLSDYLRVDYSGIDVCARESVISDLRSVLENLMLMRFLYLFKDKPRVLAKTLFLKDGPLLLHAQLSRLVDPIRAYLKYLVEEKEYCVHILGTEKTGDLVNHIPMIKEVLTNPGDYFIPSVQYVHERIKGIPYDPVHYQNKVQYGSKVVVRLGPDHVIALNAPTGDFKVNPSIEDFYGFKGSVAALSEMLSYSYENALIPIVLVNNAASISMRASGTILESFAHRLLQ